MGSLKRLRLVAVLVVIGLVVPISPLPAEVHAGTGFGNAQASSTFGVDMTFTVGWSGGSVDRIEILLDYNGDESTFIAQAELADGVATYQRDITKGHETPNTKVHYRWRAVSGTTVTNGPSGDLLYDDDRFSWQKAGFGETTVYWYGNNEAGARRMGRQAAEAASQAGDALGVDLAAPIEIFVYETGSDFFTALGGGVREWTGAATYPDMRTIFMRMDAGNTTYRDLTLGHEVTHVVFHDATDNPFNRPAKWVNEGFATWSEEQNAPQEERVVEDAADGDPGLFAFPALVGSFPIRGTFKVAYAQSATMIDMLIDTYGQDVMADMATAYRAGVTDDEALEAATGVPAANLYASYFDRYGVTEPPPVPPESLLDSDVPLPPQQNPSPVAQPTDSPSPVPSVTPTPADEGGVAAWSLLVVLGVLLLGGGGLYLVSRRRSTP